MSNRKSQLISCRASITGFALLEMIGVLAVMAILAGAMAPFLLNQIDRSEADAEQAALDAIAEGVRQYYLDDSVATYGTLPANLAALSGGYVNAAAADLVTNDRGVARLYQDNGATLVTIPRITIASHLLVGGAAPADMSACVGSALAAIDPCGDSPGTTTDDMPAGMATNLIKVSNLNLSKERAAIVDHIRGYYLAPVVSAIEGLGNDVCQSIADGTSDIDGNDPAGNPIPPPLVNSAPGTGDDHWGNKLQITKTGSRVDVWSSGPVAMAPVPTNPLYLTATCASGSDVAEQLEEIADTVMAFMLAQTPSPTAPPVSLAAAGVTNNLDPWGAPFVYGNAGAGTPPSFTLSSDGPSGAAGDDIDGSKTTEEIQAFFAKQGRSYPDPNDINNAACAAAGTYIETNCDTEMKYLTDASACNTNIALDQQCSTAGY
ncbi:MAG: hypothetical protein VW985_05225 [Gammaproteobacteria bacterium]